MEQSKIGLTINDVGIADALMRWQLTVPLNQRSYAWKDDSVETLLSDLTKAFDAGRPIYFLGTIVLTEAPKNGREVADGQQRLATVAILLGAIRDYLIELNDAAGAQQYQSDFLIKYDPPTGQYRAKLRLNVQDDAFFHSNILLPPAERQNVATVSYTSNERLMTAASLAKEHVKNITAAVAAPAEKAKKLYQWVEFLKESALIIAITVPPQVSNSFRMFETLNARGVRASQVDILKNFLFDKAPDSKAAIQAHWISMLSVIEALGDDELLLKFIRHLWISLHGPTTEMELGESIERTILIERQAVDFVALLNSSAGDYIALMQPMQSSRWAQFTDETRKTIDIISNEFGGEQIRPLMLAVSRHFTEKEAARAFRSFLSWSVRFLIVGGAGGGKLERYYSLRAAEVTKGKIKTVDDLLLAMNGVLPRNQTFQEEFARASVRRANLARYYLRAIELYRGNDPHPQLLINEDPDAVNLEHILPISPSDGWTIDADTAQTFHKRLGNMVLLKSKDNVKLGNGSFASKKHLLSTSPFKTTLETATCTEWGPDEIKARQLKLAADAPKVWPL